MESFIQRIRSIEYEQLTVAELREHRIAFKEALEKVDAIIAGLASSLLPPKKQAEAVRPEPPKEEAPRRRGRPGAPPRTRVAPPTHDPIAVGGAQAEERPATVDLIPNSYVSKEGPQSPRPARAPGDRDTVVARTGDEKVAEKAVAAGRVQDMFN